MSTQEGPPLVEGWAWASIGDVTEGKVDQSGPHGKGEFTYIDIGSIDNRSKRITDPKSVATADAPSRAKQVVAEDDVLVSMTRPNLNAVALVSEKLGHAIASTGFDVLRSRAIAPKWLFYFVQTNQFVEAMSRVVQGALYPAVRPKDIRGYVIPLAPLNEQRRIVEKIEGLFSELDAGVATLERAKANLKRYRASVLKAAVEGNLTAEWRAKHLNVEPASKLVERILKERRRKWDADQLAKFAAAGKQPSNNWQAKYVEPTHPQTTDLGDLPETWSYCRLAAR